MSIQTEEYIKEMKKMYEKIIAKKTLTEEDIMFLLLYKKTIDCSIEVDYE